MNPEDLGLLKLIAEGATHFRPVQDEPSDSPRWLQQVERLRWLRSQGMIRMPEPEEVDNQPGYPAGVGPCELTAEGRYALDRLNGEARRGGPDDQGLDSAGGTGATGGASGSG